MKVLKSHPDIFESQHKMFSVKDAFFKKGFGTYSEACVGPRKLSKMEVFTKIIKG